MSVGEEAPSAPGSTIRGAGVTLEQFLAAVFRMQERSLARLWSLADGEWFVEDRVAQADSEVIRDYSALHGIDPGPQVAKIRETRSISVLSNRRRDERRGELLWKR
jgi:hypothetical protein